MNKKQVLAAVVVSVILFSAMVGVRFVRLAEANFFPLPTPLPAFFIRSDGSVDPSTAPIQRVADVYTFTDDIVGYTIAVERDNIVLDGGGYTLQGNGNSTGIFLQERSNVVVRNMEIRNFSRGITLYVIPGTDSRNNTISGNTITNNTRGISISFGGSNVISGNIVEDNGQGVSIHHSPNNVFRNNQLTNNKYNLLIYCGTSVPMTYFINDIDNSNTVNGKPVIYWVNEQDKTVPSDAGYVALVNCRRITVQNLNLANNSQGVLLVSTDNSLITKNHITNNGDGIMLYGPYEPCTYNRIVENNITGNAGDGIDQWGGPNGNITKNHITNNQVNGIKSSHSRDNNVIGNTITGNKDNGIKLLYDSDRNNISENYIVDNNNSIQIISCMHNRIDGNYWSDYKGTDNDGDGIGDTPYIIDGGRDNYPLVPYWVPPAISIISPENRTYTANHVSLTFTVSKKPPSWIGYGLDGRASLTIAGNTTLTELSDGVYSLTVYANDTAGNIGSSNTISFTIDLPPSISIQSPQNRTYDTTDTPITFTVTETVSWMAYSLDEQANVTITENTTLTELSDGSHSLVIYAEDSTGNTGTSETIHFSVAKKTEFFPTWIVAVIVIIVVVAASLLVYFAKGRKTTEVKGVSEEVM